MSGKTQRRGRIGWVAGTGDEPICCLGLSGVKVVLMGSRKQQALEVGYLHSEGVCCHDAQDSMSHDWGF